MATERLTKEIYAQYVETSDILKHIKKGKWSVPYYDPDTDIVKLFHDGSYVIWKDKARIRVRMWTGADVEDKTDETTSANFVVDFKASDKTKNNESWAMTDLDVWLSSAEGESTTDPADIAADVWESTSGGLKDVPIIGDISRKMEEWWEDNVAAWWEKYKWIVIIIVILVIAAIIGVAWMIYGAPYMRMLRPPPA